MTILYFTATGNNLHIAKEIGGELISIPQAVKAGNYDFKDDKIGIVFPIYGWAVPQYIREFLEKVRLDSKYIFAVLSYGMIPGAAISQLIKIGSENDINFSYANIIKMVDNYLLRFEMGKQIRTEPEKQIEMYLSEIVGDINTGRQFIYEDPFIQKFASKYINLAEKFKTGPGITDQCRIENTCTKCGICSMLCPVDNIQQETEKKPTFGANCISCLACTQNCPQNSIRLTEETSKIRFRNQYISLNEIIESNK